MILDIDDVTGDVVWKLRERFRRKFDSSARLVVRAPGRVNLIGDHTDYNDGFVLPATIHRGVYAVLSPRTDMLIRLHSVNFDESLEYRIEVPPSGPDVSWKNYVTGAVEELRVRGDVTIGFDMLIYGDVPLGAGLSSSAALTVTVAFGLDTLFEIDIDPIEMIRLCQRVEHRYAGVQCGIMDQFCSRLGCKDHALFLDCRSLDHEHVPLRLYERDLALVIVDSRVSRELAASKYGERRRDCESAVEALRETGADVTALRDVTADMLESKSRHLSGTIARRALHVVDENARVLRAREALRASAYSSFGELMNASHESLRDLFEVSAPELDLLVAEAQSVEGVLGARMTGGGFGGCTVNLVRIDAVDRMTLRLENAYTDSFGRKPKIYVLTENYETDVLYRDS